MAEPLTDLLTESLLDELADFRDDWVRIGVSVERCDRPAVEAAVRDAYRLGRWSETPPRMVWMDSPIGGAIATAAIFQGHDHADIIDLNREVSFPAGRQLYDRLGGSNPLYIQLRDEILGRRQAPVVFPSWPDAQDQLHAGLGERIRSRVLAQIEIRQPPSYDAPWDHPITSDHPGHSRQPGDWFQDAVDHRGRDWITYSRWSRRIAGLPAWDVLEAVATVDDGVGWWFPMTHAVVLTDRPIRLHLDEHWNLHSGSGPAARYADGYDLHAWHGRGVPAGLIRPGWPAERILGELDEELRRCAVEHIGGWRQLVAEAGLTQLGAAQPDPGNPGGELILYALPDSVHNGSTRLLVCRDGTPGQDGTYRWFGLQVPASITDPVAAAAWTVDLHPDHYRHLVRRT